MEDRRFCVYNQTNECFLSMGVAAVESTAERLTELAGPQARKGDEGLWLAFTGGLPALHLDTKLPLDLIYLDRNCKVVHCVESLKKFSVAAAKTGAASLLALPAHTIYSSQTQPGDQLVICVAEEMQFQLGGTPGLERRGRPREIEATLSGANAPQEMLAEPSLIDGSLTERRIAHRRVWPRLVAHDWDGAELVVHGIRDASATGLYLLTEKRWPLGALVWMTLQRTDKVDEGTETSVTVQMKVTRWGVDGVGLEFYSPSTLDSSEWIKEERTAGEAQTAGEQEEEIPEGASLKLLG